MADSLRILNAIAETKVDLSRTATTAVSKALNSALITAMKGMKLESVRLIDQSILPQLQQFFEEDAKRTELKAIAKAWDPSAAISEALTQQECAAVLVDLVAGRRDPYSLNTYSLYEAQALPETLRHILYLDLSQRAPPSHISKVLTRWDKHFMVADLSRTSLLDRLRALLERAVDPTPKPQTSVRSRKLSE
jgi:hypothetical protein